MVKCRRQKRGCVGEESSCDGLCPLRTTCVDWRRLRVCRYWTACSSTCTKVLLIIVNFVFLVCGAVLAGLGFLMYMDRESLIYMEFLHHLPSSGPLVVLEKMPAILISVGGMVVTLSFLGCYGACTDSVCFLFLYTILLFLILSTEIICGVLLAVFREKILKSLELSMQHQIMYEYNKTALYTNVTNTTTYQITTIWDTMQVKLNCCGAVGPQDYRNSAWFNHTNNREGVFVPQSCCMIFNDEPKQLRNKVENICQISAILFPKGERDNIALKTQGCRESAVQWLKSHSKLVVILISSVSILQIVHFVFACSLLGRLRRSHSDYQCYEDYDCG